MIGWIIPAWLKRAALAALAGVAALLGAWLAGRREGRSRAKSDALAKDAEAKGKALEVRNEIDAKSGDDVRADLDKWMRD